MQRLNDQENQDNEINDVLGVELPTEVICNIFSFFPPSDLKKIATTSKKFYCFSKDEFIFRSGLKNHFGIELNKQMDQEKFIAALNQQKKDLWESYTREFLIVPVPEDAQLFLEQLFENPADIYDKYETLNSRSLLNLTAMVVACARGYEEMVIYLITKGHLVPLMRANSLCEAINGHHMEIVKHLINSGADVTECQFLINSSYGAAYGNGNISLENVPLPDSNYHQLCPLASAIKVDDVEIATLLLDSGANFDNLSFVHPIDKKFNEEKQRTVTQLIDEGRLTLSSNMKKMIEERQNSIQIDQHQSLGIRCKK
jgi:hypothetical protein